MYSEEDFISIMRNILLNAVDSNWMEYLDLIDHIRQASQLASYKQQDPVQAFTLDSFKSFNEMTLKIRVDTILSILNIEEPIAINDVIA